MTDRTLTQPEETRDETPAPARTDPDEPTGAPRPIFLPILLIGLGLVLLLQNLGVVDGDVWRALARLWPLALIGIGLDLLVRRRSSRVRIGIAAAVLALLAALTAWMLATGTTDPTLETIDEARADVEQVELRLSTGGAGLRLTAEDTDSLVTGTVAVPGGHGFLRSRTDQDGTAEIALGAEGDSWFGFVRRSEAPSWDLRVAADVPTVLDLDAGVGGSVLDLRDADLRDLTVDAEVGSTRITLPTSGAFEATIDGGVGEIVVRVPESLAVRILADTGVGDVTVDGPWIREGARWVSDDWDTATDRVVLNVRTGVGAVRVEQVG